MSKIKGSSSAIKMKYLLIVFATAVLVALPTRVYQLLALVDVSNGFYKESDVTIPLLYGIVAVFTIVFLVLSFLSKEVPSPKLPTGKNPILGVTSMVMVAGLAWDMVTVIKNTVPVNQGNSQIFISLLRSNLAEQGGALTILRFVFAFFAIIYFIVFAMSHLNGKASYKEFKLLAISPLCWSMTMLVSRLMNAISFTKVSELLFEIFMFMFMMCFFITFARISSGVFTEDCMWGIYGYGFAATLFAALVTIPRIVILAVGLKNVEGNEFSITHLTALVFILSYIFASLGVGFKDGIKNRRTVNEIVLPDVEKKASKDATKTEVVTEAVITEAVSADEEIAPEVAATEMINRQLAELEKEAEAEVIEEAIEEIAEEEPEAVEEVIEEITEEEPEVIEEVVKEAIEEEPEVIEEVVEEAIEEETEVIEEVSEEAIEEELEVIEEVAEEAIEEEPEVIEDVVEEATEEEPEVIEEVIEEITEEEPEVVEDVIEEVTEEEPEAVEDAVEKKEKKSFVSGLFKKSKVEENTSDNEFSAISLAELKNRKNEE